MEKLPLDVCVQPAHAEHSRPMDSDEPCDDGRSGWNIYFLFKYNKIL